MVVGVLDRPTSRTARAVSAVRRWFSLLIAMANEMLDDTGLRRRRSDDAMDAPPQKQGPPSWLLPMVLYLVGQLVTSIWWAATMQSDVRYLQAENAKLWERVQVLDMQRDKLENNLDERIRGKVRETMDDWGYLRVRPHKED